MTTKDYSDPKITQKLIDKARYLQEEFNREINLDYLEEATKILKKAIEKTQEDDPSHKKYIDERNRLFNRYPDIENWLSGHRYDYQLDLKYIYSCLNENHEYLDRYVIIKYLNEFNRKKEKDMQEFFLKYKKIFMYQFDYALVGFEGKRLFQDFAEKVRWQNWVGIFLTSMAYPNFASDETFIVKNAPPLDGEKKIYLPIRPNFLDEDSHKFLDQKVNNGDHSYIMPINIDVWYWEDVPNTTRGYFEFSSQLIRTITSLNKLIYTDALNNLAINSFHFLIDYLYINGDVYEKIKNSEGSYNYWESGGNQYGVTSVIDKQEIPSANWAELRQIKGNREECIFGTIEIKNNNINLRLVFNNHPYNSFEYEYWEENPNSYEIPISDFLAMFPDLDQDEN
jgi:hypothetical protein